VTSFFEPWIDLEAPMTIRKAKLAFVSIAILLALANVAIAQRGRGGMVGNRGGGGGGGIARPSVPQNFNRPASIPQNINLPANINQNINRPANINQNINRPTNINQNINRPTNVNQNNVNNRTNISNNININNISNNRVNSANNLGNINRNNFGSFGVSHGAVGNRTWGGNGFYGNGYHANSYFGYHSNWVNGSWGGYRPGWGRYGYGYGGYPGWGYGAALGIGAGIGVASWGLGSLFNNWGYSQYSNPYYASAYAAQPANFAPQSLGYDYSMPINLASAPPEETVLQTSAASLDSARQAFHAGDYNAALGLADQALKQTPNDPMLHEFRATSLFALGRYDEAAVPFYTVLSAGPGWDWTTMIGLYPDVETYTNQLRALEAYCNATPQAASARFVLAALYLTQGSKDAATGRLREIVAIQPQDQLSAQLLQAITTEGQPADVANQAQPTGTPPNNPAPAQGASSAPPEAPDLPDGPVPANLIASWKATPAQNVTITLNLIDDKSFSWTVVEKGHSREFKGEAKFANDTLALIAPEMPPMVAKVTFSDATHFNFKAVGSPPEDPGLNFGK
jgi:tetratricopeptide (TPR) repeat protein